MMKIITRGMADSLSAPGWASGKRHTDQHVQLGGRPHFVRDLEREEDDASALVISHTISA